MKQYILFDFSGTLAKMRPPTLFVNVRLLEKLSETYLLGIVTGGRRSEVRNILNKFKILDLFSLIITLDDSKYKKPNPKVVSKNIIIKTYIGDTKNDEVFAKNLKVSFSRINNKYNINRVIRELINT